MVISQKFQEDITSTTQPLHVTPRATSFTLVVFWEPTQQTANIMAHGTKEDAALACTK